MTTIEICDGLTVADMKRIFELAPPAIDTAARRLEAWGHVGPGCNLARVGDVLYSWDARPRRQKNDALIGRVYAQRAGEAPRDVGAYKIDAGGQVLQLPAALRGVLPGGHDAAIGTEDAEGGPDAGE